VIIDTSVLIAHLRGDERATATADVYSAGLKTLNVKHFPMFNGLQPAF